MNRHTIVRTVLSVCAVLLLLTACGGTPEEKVARLRGMYSARLNESAYGSFIVQRPQAVEEATEEATEEEGEPVAPEADTAEAEGDEEAAEPVEAPPANPNIMLDILIQHDSPEKLPGITVDITMADAAGNQKGAWKVWFDTADLPKANVRSYTHVLEDVPWEEGLGFHAEIRHPVPAEEYGDYKEFSSAG